MRHPLRPFEIANYQPRLKWYITSVNDLRCWVTPWSPPSTGFPRSRGKCPKDKGAVIPQEEQGDARSASNARPAYPLCLTAFPPRAGETMAVWNSTFDQLHPLVGEMSEGQRGGHPARGAGGRPEHIERPASVPPLPDGISPTSGENHGCLELHLRPVAPSRGKCPKDKGGGHPARGAGERPERIERPASVPPLPDGISPASGENHGCLELHLRPVAPSRGKMSEGQRGGHPARGVEKRLRRVERLGRAPLPDDIPHNWGKPEPRGN